MSRLLFYLLPYTGTYLGTIYLVVGNAVITKTNRIINNLISL